MRGVEHRPFPRALQGSKNYLVQDAVAATMDQIRPTLDRSAQEPFIRRLTGLPTGFADLDAVNHWRKWPGRAACGLSLMAAKQHYFDVPGSEITCTGCLALVASQYPMARFHVLCLSSLDDHDISGDSCFKNYQLLDHWTYEEADTLRRHLAGRTLIFKKKLNLKPEFTVQLDLRLVSDHELEAPVAGCATAAEVDAGVYGVKNAGGYTGGYRGQKMQGVIADEMQGDRGTRRSTWNHAVHGEEYAHMQGDRGLNMQGDTG